MATGYYRKRTSASGEKSYQITVECERDPLTGKRNRQYKTVHGTQKQAEKIMKKMIQDIESGGIITPSAMTVGDWVTMWLRDFQPNIEATTREGYQEKIDNYIIPSLGRMMNIMTASSARSINPWNTAPPIGTVTVSTKATRKSV